MDPSRQLSRVDQVEAETLSERFGDKLSSFRLALCSGVLVLVMIPIYGLLLSDHLLPGADAWLLVTPALYGATIAALVALGRWAKRVDGEISAGEVRLSFTVMLAMAPLSAYLGRSWWRDGQVLAGIAGCATALGIVAWFAYHVRTIRRDAAR